MILVWFIIVPTAAGLLAWLMGHRHPGWSRWISLIALAINLILALTLLTRYVDQLTITPDGPWLAEINLTWIPQLGISFHLAVDGLSLVLILLTAFLGMAAYGGSPGRHGCRRLQTEKASPARCFGVGKDSAPN